MSRSTLKLPMKPVTPDAAGDQRGRPRKPIRGGSPAAKHQAVRRVDDRSADPMPAPDKAGMRREPAAGSGGNVLAPDAAAAAGRGETAPGSRPVLPEAAPPPRGAPGTATSRTVDQAVSGRGKAERSGERAKTYPPRGIARSTGVRALPPAPQRAPRAAQAEAGVATDLPPVVPVGERPGHSPAITPLAPDARRRGLPKESPRLAKLVSALAQCSRREADEWIENGWVSVDGVMVKRLGARVNPKARIEIREAAGKHRSENVTILFNKPAVPVEMVPDTVGENVRFWVRADNQWPEDAASSALKATHLRGLATAGALDAEAGGMLVFTQEGSVARRLSGGDARLEKEYHVRVTGELPPNGLDLLRHGLVLDTIKLLPAEVSWLGEQRLRFVLHENRKQQISRMCELVGLQVSEIRRVRIGSVSLGKLPSGQWRFLRADERF